MKKWKVEGKLRADIGFEEYVLASTEAGAIRKAEKIVYERYGLKQSDIVDDDVYCEKIT